MFGKKQAKKKLFFQLITFFRGKKGKVYDFLEAQWMEH